MKLETSVPGSHGFRAKAVDNMIPVLSQEELPNGVNVVTVSCDGYDELKKLPKVIEYHNRVYGQTGWNSDKNVAYYRDDAQLARCHRHWSV